MTASATVQITVRHGLHSRPSATLARVAGFFSSEITIHTVDGRSASARSPLSVFNLKIQERARVTVTATGDDEETAVGALSHMIAGPHVSPAADYMHAGQLEHSPPLTYTARRVMLPRLEWRHVGDAFPAAWGRSVAAGEPLPLAIGTPIYRDVGVIVPIGDPQRPGFRIIPRGDGLTDLALHYLGRRNPAFLPALRRDASAIWRISRIYVALRDVDEAFTFAA